MKKISLVIITLLTVLGIAFYIYNLPQIRKEVDASHVPPQVDVKINVVSDGLAPFDATTWSDSNMGNQLNDAGTNAGTDANASNLVVRAGDSVTYRIRANLNHGEGNNTKVSIVLDNGRWSAIPSSCLTVAVTPISSISLDGKTLLCNLGIIKEGTVAEFTAGAKSLITKNDTKLKAIATVSTDGGVTSSTQTPEEIIITGSPKVDLIKDADNNVDSGAKNYGQAIKHGICWSGTDSYILTTAACNPGYILGKVITFKYKLQHGQYSELLSDTSFTLTDTFSYVAGDNTPGDIQAQLFTGDGPAYEDLAGNGDIIITESSRGTQSVVYTINISNIDDSLTGEDGLIYAFTKKIFVPQVEVPTMPTLLNISDLVEGQGVNRAGFHPTSATGLLNNNNVNEYTLTCTNSTDPAACNNLLTFGLVFPIPGAACANHATQILGNPGAYVSCPNVPKVNSQAVVSPGSYSNIFNEVAGLYNFALQPEQDVTVCYNSPTDTVGNPYYKFTGGFRGGREYHNGTADYQTSTDQEGVSYVMIQMGTPNGGHFYLLLVKTGSTVTWYGSEIITTDIFPEGGFKKIGNTYSEAVAAYPNLLILYSEFKIQFSTTPTLTNNYLINTCEDNEGPWVDYEHGTRNDYTRMRIYLKKGSGPSTSFTISSTPEVFISPTLPASVLKIPTTFSVKYPTVTNDAYKNYFGGPVLYDNVPLVTPGDFTIAHPDTNYDPLTAGNTSITQNFKNQFGQDVFFVVQSAVGIEKTVSKDIVEPGDEVTFEIQPHLYAPNSISGRTITITDYPDAPIKIVPNSLRIECPSGNCSGIIDPADIADGFPVLITGVEGETQSPLKPMPKLVFDAVIAMDTAPGSYRNVAYVDQGITTNDPSSNDTKKSSVATVQVVAKGAYWIWKEVLGASSKPVDSAFDFKLNYYNMSALTYTNPKIIDILPYNGDGAGIQDRDISSDYTGKATFYNLVANSGQVFTVKYTTADPNIIPQDPSCLSNGGTISATDFDGDGTPNGTDLVPGDDWQTYCLSSDAPITWTPIAATDLYTVPAATAILIEETGSLGAGVRKSYSLKMTTHDNVEGDIYTNSFSSRVVGIDLPVVSNDVTVTVYEGSIGNKVWFDRDGDGVIGATELPMKNVCVKLEVDASDANWVTNYPLIDKTKLDSGSDGLFGTVDDMSLVVMTDTNGNYLFDHLPSAIFKVSVLLDPLGDPACVGATSYPTALTPTYDLDDGKTLTPATPNSSLISICSHYELVKDSFGNVVLPVAINYIDPLTGLPTTNALTGVPTLVSIDNKVNDDPNNNGNVLGGTDYSRRDCNEAAATFLEDADFGYKVYNISGSVWYDTNEDGVHGVLPACTTVGSPMSATECGLPAETLKLLDVLGNPVLDVFGNAAVAVTDSLGYYQFIDLLPGSYTVVETQPAGFGSSTPNTLPAVITNADVTGIDFGEVVGLLDGCVYVDANNDGIKDLGELPLVGVSITLTGNDVRGSVVNVNQLTDALGCYRFIGLLEGTYSVAEVQPVAYLDGKETAGTSGGQTTTNDVISNISLISGGESLQNNFGELYIGEIKGCVYADYNVNDIFDAGDQVIPAVVMNLKDSGGVTIKTQTTDALGCYDFPNLPNGTYSVEEIQPTTYLNGKNFINGGTVDGTDDLITGIVIAANVDPQNDFSEYPISGLSGIVYHDRNQSFTQMPDLNEEGLAGWTITLTSPLLGSPLTTVTDFQGRYNFPNLVPGSYTVTETQNPSFAGSYEIDNVQTVVVPAVPLTNVNFGEYLGTISCKVYRDINENNVFDNGTDIPMPGEEVKLVNGINSLVLQTAYTDVNGDCLFLDLVAGNYKVVETQPLGYASTQNPTNQISVILPAGGNSAGNNFGETLASISGHVFADQNLNEVLNILGPDTPIAGVTITLSGTDVRGGTINAVTTTNAMGYYEFKDLLAGQYNIVETQPVNYVDSKDFVGDLGGTLGADQVTRITILAGENGINYDFLEIPLADISGQVWYDKDRDSVKDEVVYIPGVTITLMRGSTVIATTTTDAMGNYEFLQYPIGPYTIVETQPLGYASSTPDSISINLTVANSINNDYGDTLSTISGTVFSDEDVSLTENAGDIYLSGVTITLVCTDAASMPVNLTMMTNASGDYKFEDLKSGVCTITETQPALYGDSVDFVGSAGGTLGNDVISAITLPAGVDEVNYDFSELYLEDISGHVWYDKNRDGVEDVTETTRVSGVTINLKDSMGTVIATTVTDATGYYEFLDYKLGSYTVEEVQPAGYGSSTSDTIAVTLRRGGSINNNYGETLSTIAGTVFADEDVSLTENAGDIYLSGVTITLVCTDAASMPVNLTMMTNASGDYKFEDLKSGVCTITETQPALYGDSVDFVGSAGGTLGNDVISAITLPAGVDEVNYDFSELYLEDISGHVWYDKNRDGVEDVTETTRVSGVTINLKDSMGTVIATTVTDATGYYEFLDYKLGSYTVEEVQPAGYGSSTSDTIAVTLRRGGSINNNYGETLSTIAGTVFADEDVSLTENAGDIYLSGVTITLECIDAASMTVILSQATDANGDYKFEDLKSGTCEVSEAQPAMYGDSLDFVGSAGGTLNNDNIADIVLGAGVDEVNYDFSEIYLDDISGHVWFDQDHDGVQDGFETIMLAGVTVSLKDANGTVVATTTTDAMGHYEFLDYPLGTYQVVETQPVNYGSSTPDMIIVNLRRGGSVNNNFGETQEASISGVAYVDLDDDGVFDIGEYVLEGVEVRLTGVTGLGGSVDMVTTTNASGGYIFAGLEAGTYKVVESQPAGYADGKEGVGSLGGVVGNDEYSNVVILGLENGVSYNFGELGGSIKVCTISDVNNNGVIDAGETGVAGQMVEVIDATGQVVMTLITMSDGCVEKQGMVLGAYTVNLRDNADYIIVGSSSTGVILASNDLTDQINYTLQPSGWIKGCVYEDVDKDKVMDSTESKLGGVTVILRDGNGTELRRMETWSNGCYDFGKSVFGNYKLEVVTKAGYTMTTEKLVLGAVTEANRVLVVDFGMVKELPKTGATNYMMLIGMLLLGIGMIPVVRINKRSK